jgi:hypothetical protein
LHSFCHLTNRATSGLQSPCVIGCSFSCSCILLLLDLPWCPRGLLYTMACASLQLIAGITLQVRWGRRRQQGARRHYQLRGQPSSHTAAAAAATHLPGSGAVCSSTACTCGWSYRCRGSCTC